MREIVFDTETTGLDVSKGHRIIEIGCVEMVDRVRTGEYFHAYINPKRDVPKSSTEIHGLTEEFLSDKPVFEEIAKSFMDFVAKDKLVIHNAAFDMKFINFELEQVGHSPISWDRAIDTLPLAKKKHPGAKATLDALCNRFGISLEKRTKHGALLDSELLADVYIELIGGAQGAMELAAAEDKKTRVGFSDKKIFREVRDFSPSNEELEEHSKFLKKIKDPAWG